MKSDGKGRFWKGQWIEIHTMQGEIYDSQVYEQQETNMVIRTPRNRDRADIFEAFAEPVVIYFFDDMQGMCSFDSAIRIHQGQTTFPIPPDEAIKKVQRRRYFRVPVGIELDVEIVYDDAENKALKLVTYDIGGGGFSFISTSEWDTERMLEGTFTIVRNQSEQSIPFKGTIVNCTKLERQKFKVGVEFIAMKESTRSEIISYCMYKQIELRNKLKIFPT